MADRKYIGPAYRLGITMPDRRLSDPANWTQEQITRFTTLWPEISDMFTSPTTTSSAKPDKPTKSTEE